jgi:hypothetical protein
MLIMGEKMEYLFRPIHIHSVFYFLIDEDSRFTVLGFWSSFVEPDCLCTHPLDLFLNRAYVFRGTRKLVPISPKSVLSVSLSLSLSVLYYILLYTSISLLYNLVLFSHVEILFNRSCL